MTLHEQLTGKRVLFLSVRLFNYEKFIAAQLQEVGAMVHYYDERPANSLYAKGIIRLKRSLYQKRINAYYKQILKETDNLHYDYLFVMKGEVVPEFFLQLFKQEHPGCIFVFYTWDSFANNLHPIAIQKYFDRSFTFESSDAKKHQMNFRPLFYIKEYERVRNLHENNFKYNLLFLGTAHSDRYRISNEVVQWCNAHNLKTFAYYYMQGRLVFLFKKFFDKSFKKFDYRKLKFSSLDTANIINLYKNAQVILDINHPDQNGLTMRTFEALAAGKKLITTNADIKKYPFYNTNNILIINRDKPVLNESFFETDFEPIGDEMFQRMSIEGWLKCIFVEAEPDYWLKGYK